MYSTDILKSGLHSFYAHSNNIWNQKQPLFTHLENVAELAQSFLTNTKLVEFARYAGILHDIGKAAPEFQLKLEKQSHNPVDHKGLGFGFGKRFKSHILQTIIAGHHGGLCDDVKTDDWWRGIKQNGELLKLKPAAMELMTEAGLAEKDFQKSEKELPFDRDIAIRMVFSALVDADFLDTERHFQPHKANARRSGKITKTFLEQYTRYYNVLCKGKTGKLNCLRLDVNRNCVYKAALAPGFFRLTVPTGGGKTLASLGFALNHAVQHNMASVTSHL